MFEGVSDLALCSFFAVIGACFGSFANVVIYRLPAGESVVRPGSFCRTCKAPVKPWHNIPILGWFILGGKCASCGTKFSFRYPAVEILTAFLFGAAYFKLGMSYWLIEILVFFFGLVVVSMIDFDHMILPDKFTLPGIVIGLVGGALNPERAFLDSVYGVLFGGGFLWAIAYLYLVLRKREGMGGGDIKLLAWIGAVLGWQAIPFVIMISSVIGSIVGVSIALMGRSKQADAESAGKVGEDDIPPAAIPFGPYLSIAAIVYVLLSGEEWARWYLRMHGLD